MYDGEEDQTDRELFLVTNPDAIKVVNIRDLPNYPKVQLERWQVYIGRYNLHVQMHGGPLQNPFSEKEHGRAGCIRLFQMDLEADLNVPRRKAMRQLMRTLTDYGKLELVCWCAPKACHGDVIKHALLKAVPVSRFVRWKGTIDFSRADEKLLRGMVTTLTDIQMVTPLTCRAKVSMTQAQLTNLDEHGYWGQFIWALKEES